MKQLESRKVEIGENIFYIRPLPAMRAAGITGDLTALFAPIIAGLAPAASLSDKVKDGQGIFDADIADIAPAIADGFKTLSGDKLESILRRLLLDGKNISVETPDKKVQVLDNDVLNEVFCEDVQDMFVLAFHVIKINYNGFFKKLAAPFGKLGELWKTAMRTPENTESST